MGKRCTSLKVPFPSGKTLSYGNTAYGVEISKLLTRVQYGRGSYRIRERLIVGDYHPSTSGEPNHVRTHVDEDEVVLSVIQLLREGLSDADTSPTTTEDYDILRWRWGRHGGRRGRRGGMDIKGCLLYMVDGGDNTLSKSRDLPVTWDSSSEYATSIRQRRVKYVGKNFRETRNTTVQSAPGGGTTSDFAEGFFLSIEWCKSNLYHCRYLLPAVLPSVETSRRKLLVSWQHPYPRLSTTRLYFHRPDARSTVKGWDFSVLLPRFSVKLRIAPITAIVISPHSSISSTTLPCHAR